MRAKIEPTDSKSATPSRWHGKGRENHYQPTDSVGVRPERAEVLFARVRGLTKDSAHQRLLELRRESEQVVDACLAAGTPERAIWFTSGMMARLDVGIQSDCLSEAAIAEQEADGAEDVAWEKYRAAGETPEAFRVYERAAHIMIARTLAKVAAGRRKHSA